MKVTNEEKRLLKALSKAYGKLKKHIRTQSLEKYKTPSPLPFKQMKKDFERFHKLEKEYLKLIRNT